MEERLRNHVNGLFESAPKTRKAFELREEIFANLKEKYDDLIKQGAQPEEAYEIVIASIGDVDELIGSLKDHNTADFTQDLERNKKQYAKFFSISIALYVLSPVFLIGFGALSNLPVIGLLCMLVCIAVATGLLLYARSTYGTYQQADDTMVEEFKTWKAENQHKEQQKESYTSIIWSITTAVYFLVSFLTMAWHISWIIFIIGGAITQIVKLNMQK